MTDELKSILDRDRSKAATYLVRETATPLLREIVNHATNAFARCATESSRQLDVDIAPLFLYHQTIELTDGLQELVDTACSRASIPLLRSLLETLISIEYIVADDDSFPHRSLSWYVGFLHEQLDEAKRLDETTTQGGDVARYWKAVHGTDLGISSPEGLEQRRRSLRARLAMPHLAEIEQKWAAALASGRRPKWYSLESGANDLRTLAVKHVPHRVPDYDLMYRAWSRMTHGQGPQDVITVEDGQIAFSAVRFPRDLAFVARMAASDAICATRAMLRKYRSGEEAALAEWYASHLKASLDRLAELHDEALSEFA